MIGENGLSCPFCDYADELARTADWGTVSPNIVAVARAEGVMVIRPLAPAAEGHVMLVPFEHVVGDPRVKRASAEHTAAALQRMLRVAQLRAEEVCGPYNLVLQVGKEGGQSVEHLHLHYVPREASDGLGYRWKGEA